MKKLLLILTISLFFLPHTCLSAGEFRKLPVDTYIDRLGRSNGIRMAWGNHS